MQVSSLSKDTRKGGMETSDIIDYCNNTGAPLTFCLPAMGPITTPRAETTTSTLTEHVTEQAKKAFCLQVAGAVGTPGSCHMYDRHCILVRKYSLDGSVQTIVPN